MLMQLLLLLLHTANSMRTAAAEKLGINAGRSFIKSRQIRRRKVVGIVESGKGRRVRSGWVGVNEGR